MLTLANFNPVTRFDQSQSSVALDTADEFNAFIENLHFTIRISSIRKPFFPFLRWPVSYICSPLFSVMVATKNIK